MEQDENDGRIQVAQFNAGAVIQPTATIININMLNQGLVGNRGGTYIFDPNQSIVYQAPVSLQQCITVPDYTGQTINNFPVSISVPITADFISNDGVNCPSFLVTSDNNDVSVSDKIVINNLDKVSMNLGNVQPVVSQKLCPLKMSIEAAELDLEFDQNRTKMDIDDTKNNGFVEPYNIDQEKLIMDAGIIDRGGHVLVSSQKMDEIIEPVMENPHKIIEEIDSVQSSLLTEDYSVVPNITTETTHSTNDDKSLNEITDSNKNNVFSDQNSVNIADQLISVVGDFNSQSSDVCEPVSVLNGIVTNDMDIKRPRTVITWDKDSSKGNDFQESLICEVEEVNDDDEENRGDSSDEKPTPNSVVLKFRVVKENNKPKTKPTPRKVKAELNGDKVKTNDIKRSARQKIKLVKEDGDSRKRPHRVRKHTDFSNYVEHWSDSDDEALNAKKLRTNQPEEDTSNVSPKPTSTKQATGNAKVIRSCCSARQCYKTITRADQKLAQKHFEELLTIPKQDGYLVNCIEFIQDTPSTSSEDQMKSENKEENSIQQDIENESNGNQVVSDEIQKAINESLKDCLEIQKIEIEEVTKCVEEVKKPESHWVFYLVIDRCKKVVCQQFLIKLFHISKKRLKELQQKIMGGIPIVDDIPAANKTEKYTRIWPMAKEHLSTLTTTECTDCCLPEKHRYFTDKDVNRKLLFTSFGKFYQDKTGIELVMKYDAYRRFLGRESKISFLQPKPSVCAECQFVEEHTKKLKEKEEGVKKVKIKLLPDKQNKKKIKLSGGSNSGELSSDDEPLSKHKDPKIKASKKTKNRTAETKKVRKRSKDEKSLCKGRDVWSLMLLHLESVNHIEVNTCLRKKKHKYFNTSLTTQNLYEDYRKFFLKETNSELGLGYSMYEKYFERNCGFTFLDINSDREKCPQCEKDPPAPAPEQLNNTTKLKKCDTKKTLKAKTTMKGPKKKPTRSELISESVNNFDHDIV